MKNIVILHSDVQENAGEDEQDCLRQAEVIGEAMALLGHKTANLPFKMDLNANLSGLSALQPDIVFNLVETVAGRGSMVYFATALLDALRLPYTGCRTDAMFLTSNKPLTKKILHAHGIDTPHWIAPDGFATGAGQGNTFIVKASWEDASVGLDEDSIVQTTDLRLLKDAIRARQNKLGFECFAEAYIDGREFNLALLASQDGVRILPPSEILFMDYPPEKLKVLDYRAKWVEDSFEYNKTERNLEMAPKDAQLLDRLRNIAEQCWRLFGLRGYARVDFRVDGQGRPWVLEINANPCLSPDAGFAAALEYAGIKYEQAIDDILRDALIP